MSRTSSLSQLRCLCDPPHNERLGRVSNCVVPCSATPLRKIARSDFPPPPHRKSWSLNTPLFRRLLSVLFPFLLPHMILVFPSCDAATRQFMRPASSAIQSRSKSEVISGFLIRGEGSEREDNPATTGILRQGPSPRAP